MSCRHYELLASLLALAEQEDYPAHSRVHPRALWHEVGDIARRWQEDNVHYLAEVIPEGGSVKDSLPGLVTLAVDIVQNEKALGLTFCDLLIDAGSGLTAASLITAYGLKWVDVAHITLPPYVLHSATTARSFGATNAKVFHTIALATKKEGFFLDPLYSTKLYLLFEQLVQEKRVQTPLLFIHSGGLFSLAGFQGQLQNMISI